MRLAQYLDDARLHVSAALWLTLTSAPVVSILIACLIQLSFCVFATTQGNWPRDSDPGSCLRSRRSLSSGSIKFVSETRG